MKHYLKIILPIVFVGLLGYFGFQIVTQINHKKQVAENIKTMPAFSYENVKGGFFSNENIIANKATLFVYYNSECEFCNEEAKMIQENRAKFSNVQLVFISNENPKEIIAFATKHKLNIDDTISFLSDRKMSFRTTFDVKSLPCMVLYNKDKQLIEKIRGQIKVETLLKKLQTTN
ncbi:redoxin domain-containing protein [Flavobacterium sp.]|uniref:peroxiredoxin family protein n=1 Tax=Flavobacterium sp. TaxID=239 RepID=UPI00333E6AD5